MSSTPLKRPWLWLDGARKLMLSGIALAAIVWLGQRAPGVQSAVAPAPSVPPEAMSTPQGPPSTTLFSLEGVPMAMEVSTVEACDAASWTPVGTELCPEPCALVDLQRSPREVIAIWLDFGDAGTPGVLGAAGSSIPEATHHAARLLCDSRGRGELALTWTSALDARTLQGRWAEPVRERQGPVPLLADSVQLLNFTSQGWVVFLDESENPQTAVDRAEVAMAHRGWRTQPIPHGVGDPTAPSPTALSPTLMNPTDQRILGAGRVLTRGDGLCLVNRVEVEGRDLLLTTCRD